MKNMLMLTSVASMVDQFFIPHIELLIRMGYKVDVACNFESGSTCTEEVVDRLKYRLETMDVDYYQIDFDRSITNFKGNYKAYKQVRRLILDKNYEFIHCHSPIGGVIGRLAGKTTKTKVIYTAHGFHFHKKSPKKSWMLYYPVELFCSMFTDGLITINAEDYALAKKRMKAKRVYYIPGVGVDIGAEPYSDCSRAEIRGMIGVPDDAILLVSVGEVNQNKNYKAIIEAIAKIGRSDIHYAVMGKGRLEKELIHLSEILGIKNQIHFLGFRDDVPLINSCADVFCFPSYREGLGLAALEAMAAGLPIITSDVHGINDYSENGKTGFKCSPDDIDGFKDAIIRLADNEDLRKTMGAYNRIKVKEYSLDVVLDKLEEIYSF